MTDIVERLRNFGPDWTRQHNRGKPIPYEICTDAASEIERLRAALHRIDGINDNPAIFNPDIEAVLRDALGTK